MQAFISEFATVEKNNNKQKRQRKTTTMCFARGKCQLVFKTLRIIHLDTTTCVTACHTRQTNKQTKNAIKRKFPLKWNYALVCM